MTRSNGFSKEFDNTVSLLGRLKQLESDNTFLVEAVDQITQTLKSVLASMKQLHSYQSLLDAEVKHNTRIFSKALGLEIKGIDFEMDDNGDLGLIDED